VGAAVLGAVIAAGINLAAAPSLVVSGAAQVPWVGMKEWTMQIDPGGNVTGAAGGATCRITAQERSELTRLVAALPHGRAEYSFGTGRPTDVHRKVTLSIGPPGKLRRYAYWDCDALPCSYQAEMDAVNRLWRFVRGLCRPTNAGQTPPEANP
jgi:hypothetical protein